MRTGLDADWVFHYAPPCSVPGCDSPPIVKIVAVWSNGPLHELKNYGLACARHRGDLLAVARDRRRALPVSDDEQVGVVEAVPLDLDRALATGAAPPAG